MLAKFHSRKFLLALAAAITALANGNIELAVGALVSYVLAEGYVDGKAAQQ